MKTVAIIGGGLSGLSLATELVDEGFDVTILEKNKYLGGRASNIIDEKFHDPVPIGPHVFVTAYHNFRRFLEKIEAHHTIVWERKFVTEVVYKGQHCQMKISNLPHPLYLLPPFLSYKFITLKEKLSTLIITAKVYMSSYQELEKLDNLNAYEYLIENNVEKGAIDKFLRLLAITCLNVPLELCSAAEFSILMKHWLELRHRHFGFARGGLGDIYTKKSEEYIVKRNGKILKNTHVKKIIFKEGKIDSFLIERKDKETNLKADLYISSLHPVDLRMLLPEDILFTDFFKNLNAFEGVPYISVNLWFDRKITNKRFWTLLNTSDTSDYMNTDFYDMSNILPGERNYSFITSNIIYSKPYNKMADREIVKKTLQELRETFPNMEAQLKHYSIHRIPYVIYAQYPGMIKHQLSQKTPIQNLYLTGDWTMKYVPQCMEAAVASGYRCAEQILKDFGINKKIYNEKLS